MKFKFFEVSIVINFFCWGISVESMTSNSGSNGGVSFMVSGGDLKSTDVSTGIIIYDTLQHHFKIKFIIYNPAMYQDKNFVQEFRPLNSSDSTQEPHTLNL